MQVHPTTLTVRGREYRLFDVYTHVAVAQKVADNQRPETSIHIVKSRGNNALYVR